LSKNPNNNNVMKIFVTGSTGFIGSSLIKKLEKDSDFEITAHTRNSGSLNDEEYLKKALAGQNIIIHLAAMLNPWGEPWSKFVESNISPTENLIKCAPVDLKQFIFISSVHVMGVKHSKKSLPLNENSPYNSSTKYAGSKVLAEEAVVRAGNLGLPYTILRPAIVYGPGDKKGMVPKITALIKQNKMILPCSGENNVHFIYIDDLVSGILHCINNPKAIKQIFILAGSRPIEMREFLGTIRNATGAKSIKTIPYWVSSCLANVLKLISSDKKEPIIHPDRLDIMCGNRTFSISKARELLDWNPAVDYKEGISRTLSSLGE